MLDIGLCCAGCSCSASGQDAVDCLDGVALLSGLTGHEPAFVGFGSAELAGAGVVGVDPASVADHVAAVAARLATVCVYFDGCVHLFPLAFAAIRPGLSLRAQPNGRRWLSEYLPRSSSNRFRSCIYSATMHPFPHGRPTSFNLG